MVLATTFDASVDQNPEGQNQKNTNAPGSTSWDPQGRESLSCFFYGTFFVFISALFVTALTAVYSGNERFVYFWDYALYWEYFRNLGSLICSDFGHALFTVFRSIRESDYNFLAVLPISPVACVFGGSRIAYIVSLGTFFVLPTAFLAARILVALRPASSSRTQATVFSAASVLFLLLHPVWIPVFEGWPDILGLALVFGIIAIYLRQPLACRSLSVLAGIGLLLACLFFVRRWYAYWVVAFFPAALVADAIRMPAGNWLKRLSASVRSLTVIGVVFSVTVWSVATPLMIRIFSTDYSVAYSAYKTSAGPMTAFLKAVDYFGPSLLVVAVLGLIVSFARNSSRYFSAFLIVQSIVISVLFYRVQDFGPQHYLLLVPLVYYGAATIIVYPFVSGTWRAFGVGGAILSLGLTVSSSFSVFSESVHERMSYEVGKIMPKVTRFPRVRNDLDRLGTLISELDKQFRKEPGQIYVIASSVTINDSILRTFCQESSPESLNCGAIVGTKQVDKRDGFPRGFLKSKYAVLATPTQYHLRAEEQRIVGILAREFETSAGVARSFIPVGEPVVLDRDVKVSIFKKVEPIPHDAVAALSEEFVGIYPEHKELFRISP